MSAGPALPFNYHMIHHCEHCETACPRHGAGPSRDERNFSVRRRHLLDGDRPHSSLAAVCDEVLAKRGVRHPPEGVPLAPFRFDYLQLSAMVRGCSGATKPSFAWTSARFQWWSQRHGEVIHIDVALNPWLILREEASAGHQWPNLNPSKRWMGQLKSTDVDCRLVQALNNKVIDNHCHGPPDSSASE
jgi:hypothetical protein